MFCLGLFLSALEQHQTPLYTHTEQWREWTGLEHVPFPYKLDCVYVRSFEPALAVLIDTNVPDLKEHLLEYNLKALFKSHFSCISAGNPGLLDIMVTNTGGIILIYGIKHQYFDDWQRYLRISPLGERLKNLFLAA